MEIAFKTPTWSSKQFSFNPKNLGLLIDDLVSADPTLDDFVEDLSKTFLLNPETWNILDSNLAGGIRHKTIGPPPYIEPMFFDVLGHLSTDRFFRVLEALDRGQEFTTKLYNLTRHVRNILQIQGQDSTPNHAASHKRLLIDLAIKRHQCPIFELIACPPPKQQILQTRWHLVVIGALQANYQCYKASQGTVILSKAVSELCESLIKISSPVRNSDYRKDLDEILAESEKETNLQAAIQRISGIFANYASDHDGTTQADTSTLLAEQIIALNTINLDPVVTLVKAEQVESLAKSRTRLIQFLKNDPWEPADSSESAGSNNDSNPNTSDGLDSEADEDGSFVAKEIEFAIHQLECKYPFVGNKYFENDLQKSFKGYDQHLEVEKKYGSRFVIWLSLTLGWNGLDVLSLKCQKKSGAAWSLDLSGKTLHRRCVRLNRNARGSSSGLILPPEEIEQVPVPEYLKKNVHELRFIESLTLGASNPDQIEQLTEDLIRFSNLISSRYPSKMRHAARLLKAHESGNVTLAEIEFANPGSRLSSPASYYARIVNNRNIGGSSLYFNIERVRTSVITTINKLLVDMKSDDSFKKWNAWNHYAQFALFLGTGARPINAAFSERRDFYLNKGLVLIDDKSLSSRNSTRVIKLPKSCQIIINYHLNKALPSLKKALKGTHNAEWSGLIQELIIDTQLDTSLPLFFELCPVDKNWRQLPGALASELLGAGDLPANALRHFSSNHLEIADREIVDALLGHEDEKLRTYGHTSARCLGEDLDVMANALESALSNLNFEVISPPELKAESISLEKPKTDLYGSRLREHERKVRNNLIDKKSNQYKPNYPISMAEWTVIKSRIKERENEADHSQIISKVYNYIFQNNLAKNFSKYETSAQATAWFDRADLIKLQGYDKSFDRLYKLVRNHQTYRSTTDLRFLFCLSLITNNGLSSEKLLSIAWAMNSEVYEFESRLCIELAILRTDLGEISEQVRLNLLQSSSDILTRYKNRKIKSVGLEERREQISSRLENAIVDILDRGSKTNDCSPLALLVHIANLLSANQKLDLPGSLQAIASSTIENRSITRSALIGRAATEIHKNSDGNANVSIGRDNKTERATEKNILLSSQLKKQIEFRQNCQLSEKYSLCSELTESHNPLLNYLKNYIVSVLTRGTTNRETLANSTIDDYFRRFLNFLESTTFESDLLEGDDESTEETIQLYLDERATVVENWDDDARQIQAFLRSKGNEVLADIHVPRSGNSIRIRSNIMQDYEYQICLRRLIQKSDIECSIFLILAFKFGLRIGEITRLRTGGLEMINTTIRVEIHSTRFWRTKTCNSNRYISPSSPLSSIENNLLRTYKEQRINSSESFLFKQDETNATTDNLRDSLRSIRQDLRIHSLRHSYATHLTSAIFSSKDVDDAEKQYAYATSTPRGKSKVTLFALGRKLGHGSITTLLQTYYHRGFEDIESHHHKKLLADDPIATATVFKKLTVNKLSDFDEEEFELAKRYVTKVIRILISRCIQIGDAQFQKELNLDQLLREHSFLTPKIKIRFESFIKRYLSADPRFWIKSSQTSFADDRRILYTSKHWKELTSAEHISLIDQINIAEPDAWLNFTREKHFIVRTIELKSDLEKILSLLKLNEIIASEMEFKWFSATGSKPSRSILEFFRSKNIELEYGEKPKQRHQALGIRVGTLEDYIVCAIAEAKKNRGKNTQLYLSSLVTFLYKKVLC